jgi:hypothetical protein
MRRPLICLGELCCWAPSKASNFLTKKKIKLKSYFEKYKNREKFAKIKN